MSDLCRRGGGPDLGRRNNVGLDLGARLGDCAAAVDHDGGVVGRSGEVGLGLKVHSWSVFNSPVSDLDLRLAILIFKLKWKLGLKYSPFESHVEHLKIED